MPEPIPKFIDHDNPPRPDKKTVVRNAVQCIVHDKKTDRVLCLKWKKFDWQTFIIGGIEEGETPQAAGMREVLEETGYKNIKFIGKLGGVVESHFFAAHKDENRIAFFTGLYFELENNERETVSENESAIADIVWVPFGEVPAFVRGAEVAELWQRLQKQKFS